MALEITISKQQDKLIYLKREKMRRGEKRIILKEGGTTLQMTNQNKKSDL